MISGLPDKYPASGCLPAMAILTSTMLHASVLWLLMWRDTPVMPLTPPAAVMLEYAPDFQVSLMIEPVPPGINQQRRMEAAVEQLTAQEKDPSPAQVNDGELEKRQQRQIKAVKKLTHEKITKKPQPAVTGNSTVTNRAAPPVQHVIASQTAAPVDSDNNQATDNLFSWEARVKAKINRVKMYPADAERRGRSGSTLISFTVNAQGDVLVSSVQHSSGTISLDRAALSAVKSAQPLPAPPPELLNSGVHKVLMPVDFSLKN